MSAFVLKLYSLLMWLGQPLLRRKLARRARQEPGYLQAVEERFGRYTQPAEAASELVWVHAVSLGETRTAALLAQGLARAASGPAHLARRTARPPGAPRAWPCCSPATCRSGSPGTARARWPVSLNTSSRAWGC